MKKYLVLASLLFLSRAALAQEPAWCGGYVKLVMDVLPATVAEQRKATSKIALPRTIPGDLIFFKGTRWNCPDGVSGLVTNVGKGYIVFVTGVAEPKQQVMLLPSKALKDGSAWYELSPEIRTYQPETDPPRPGDKNYKPE